MENYFSETSLSFFEKSQKRILKKTGVEIIDEELKEGGLQNIIEIYSTNPNNGIECFMKILVYSILPEDYEGDVKFGGSNLKVFYFDNNFKFVIWRFIQILESYILECCRKKYPNLKEDEDIYNKIFKGKNNYEEFIRKCMSNIKLFQCANAFQFYTTLESIVESNHSIPLILIDSLNTFYHLDKSFNEKSCHSLIKLSLMGILIFITKYPLKKAQEFVNQEFMFNEWEDSLFLKLMLEESTCKLKLKSFTSKIYNFNITNNGIHFTN